MDLSTIRIEWDDAFSTTIAEWDSLYFGFSQFSTSYSAHYSAYRIFNSAFVVSINFFSCMLLIIFINVIVSLLYCLFIYEIRLTPILASFHKFSHDSEQAMLVLESAQHQVLLLNHECHPPVWLINFVFAFWSLLGTGSCMIIAYPYISRDIMIQRDTKASSLYKSGLYYPQN